MITMRHLSMRGRGCRYSRVIKQLWRQSQSVFSFDRCLPWFFLWRIRFHTKGTSLKTWLNNVTNITRAVAEKGSFFQVTCRMKALNLIKSKIAGNKYEH